MHADTPRGLTLARALTAAAALSLFFAGVSAFAEPSPAPAASAAPAPAASAAPAASTAPAANLPSAEQIMEDYIKATGGRAAREKLRNSVSEGSFEVPSMSMTGKVISYSAAPNLSYAEVEIPNVGKQTSGCDGTDAWMIIPMQGPRIMQGEDRESMLRDSAFNEEIRWKELYEKGECIGIEKVNDADCYKIVLTPKTGKPVTMYFDKNSHLLLKRDKVAKSPMGEFPVESFFTDYRDVSGILTPHAMTEKAMSMEQKVTLTKVQYNVDLPPDRFALPAEVKALKDGPSSSPAGSAAPAPSPAGSNG